MLFFFFFFFSSRRRHTRLVSDWSSDVCSSDLDEGHLAEAEELLRSCGHVVRIAEQYQDAVTAISGSGPAYIFYVVEAMIEAGVLLGLPRATATELVVQTLYGAATM